MDENLVPGVETVVVGIGVKTVCSGAENLIHDTSHSVAGSLKVGGERNAVGVRGGKPVVAPVSVAARRPVEGLGVLQCAVLGEPPRGHASMAVLDTVYALGRLHKTAAIEDGSGTNVARVVGTDVRDRTALAGAR